MTSALDATKWLHYKRTKCRLCNASELEPVLELAPTPPANGLLTSAELANDTDKFPLRVERCGACGHVQLVDVVNPDILFRHYLYVSKTSTVMVAHLRRQAIEAIERLGLMPGDFIVEIGSNDGTLLRFFKDAGMRVLGVDPAQNLAKLASETGIPTWPVYFDETVAGDIVREHGKAKAILANHCLAHIDDLSGIARGVRTLLDSSGELIFEIGYLLDVYQKTLFDTIYHEHLDYHHVEPLIGFFERHGLTLKHVERHDIQGGALRGFVGLGTWPCADSVAELIAVERAVGIDGAAAFRSFKARIDQRARELMSLLEGLKQRGQQIAGYGVPAKATTLMHCFKLDGNTIDYIVDDNPLKQGRFTPGYHVPVVAADVLHSNPPDYLLVLAWNIANSLISAHENFSNKGGRFIVPLPNLLVQ
jgi:hypothetical protein